VSFAFPIRYLRFANRSSAQCIAATRKYIADQGKSNFIAVSTGFWYEWSLAIAPAFGVDLLNKKATLFDEGETKISISTWPQVIQSSMKLIEDKAYPLQVGRAVAALLSLPIKAEDGKDTCLEQYANKMIYVNSFTINQKEMLESSYRVTDTKESDWEITKEPS
jgi:hypothetical protein